MRAPNITENFHCPCGTSYTAPEQFDGNYTHPELVDGVVKFEGASLEDSSRLTLHCPKCGKQGYKVTF